MSGSYDAIVLGAGVDGLAAAATLAQAGRRTLVLDGRTALGGRAARSEFHPGYTAPGLLPDDVHVRRPLIEPLGLEQHGLAWRATRPALHGAGGIVLASSVDRGLDAPDAAALTDLRAFASTVAPILGRILDSPPPPRGRPALGEALAVLRTALDFRRLPERPFYELQRVLSMAASDWLEECFDAPELRALLSATALPGSHVGPRAAGTGLHVLLDVALGHGGVQGGPAALDDALAAAARASGTELRLGASPAALLVENGSVQGVRLEDGEQLASTAVLSTLGVVPTLTALAPRGVLSERTRTTARHWRTRGDTSILRLALSGPPVLAGAATADAPPERFVTAEDTRVQERAADALKYGECPERLWLDGWLPTVSTPELAPAGHHVLVLALHGTPRDLGGRPSDSTGGWTESARGLLTERALAELERFAPGAPSLVAGRELLTPVELEQRYDLPGGHLQRGETTLDQLYALRPGLALSRFATDLGGLWLGGADAHPGGLAASGAGVLAARALLASRT